VVVCSLSPLDCLQGPRNRDASVSGPADKCDRIKVEQHTPLGQNRVGRPLILNYSGN
jgi:hypothetical protein